MGSLRIRTIRWSGLLTARTRRGASLTGGQALSAEILVFFRRPGGTVGHNMQPTLPSAPPSRSVAAWPHFSAGPGFIAALLVFIGFIYLVDHTGEGEAAVFGSVERHLSTPDFHGAECTAVIGDCKMDLRDAQMRGAEAI